MADNAVHLSIQYDDKLERCSVLVSNFPANRMPDFMMAFAQLVHPSPAASPAASFTAFSPQYYNADGRREEREAIVKWLKDYAISTARDPRGFSDAIYTAIYSAAAAIVRGDHHRTSNAVTEEPSHAPIHT